MVDWNCCNFDLFQIFFACFCLRFGFFTFVITLFYAFGTFYPTFFPFRFPLIRFDTFFSNFNLLFLKKLWICSSLKKLSKKPKTLSQISTPSSPLFCKTRTNSSLLRQKKSLFDFDTRLVEFLYKNKKTPTKVRKRHADGQK